MRQPRVFRSAAHVFVTTAPLAGMLGLILAFGMPRRSGAQESAARRAIVVSAMDKRGALVPDLTAANFRGKVRGQDVTILSARFDATTPRHIAVVVDTSESMAPAWGSAWAAAADIVVLLANNNRLALFTLNDRLRQESGLSSDGTLLQEALSRGRAQTPLGPSALYNAIVTLSQGLSGERLDVIYLLTDGGDTASLATPSDAQVDAVRRGVRLFVLLFSPRRLRGQLPLVSPGLRKVSEATGGYVFRAEEFEGVEELRSFYPVMTGAYHLEVALPQGLDKTRDWKLEAIDANGKEMKNVRLVYPRQLVPSPD